MLIIIKNNMNTIELTEKESILQELEELKFSGHLLEIEYDEDEITERIILEPLDEYFILLKRLRKDTAGRNKR